MKNRKLLMVASLILALAVSLGGTLAYLTDTDADVNTMVLGNVKIAQHEYERQVDKDGDYKKGTVVHTDGEDKESYLLQTFTQNKPLLPIVGDPSKPGNDASYDGYDATYVYMSQVDSYGSMEVFAGKNAVDKFVTVENTGNSDAYVRTYVAIEVGSTKGEMIGTSYHRTWALTSLGILSVNGNNYEVTEYAYVGTINDEGQHPNGLLPAGETTYPNLSQVYIKSEADNDDLEALDGNNNGTLDIIVLSQAVQADGFTNAENALTAGFGEATATNADGKQNIVAWLEAASTSLPKVATSNDELSAEIAAGKEKVVLTAGNYTMPNANIQNKTLTITGTKDTKIDMSHVYDNGNQSFAGATMVYDGVTLTFGTDNYKGLAHTESVTFKNCTINGLQFLFADNVTFENCVLNSNGAEHCFWTWGADNVTVTNCDFVYSDRAVNCYAEHQDTTAITFTDCTFTKVDGKATTGAIETNSSLMKSLTLTIDNCSVNEGDLWWVSSWDSASGANTIVNGQSAKTE